MRAQPLSVIESSDVQLSRTPHEKVTLNASSLNGVPDNVIGNGASNEVQVGSVQPTIYSMS